MANYVTETNPLSAADREARKNLVIKQKVYWATEGLRITRLRLLTDSYCPVMDVSYCEGELDGEVVDVQLPFFQLTKRKWKTELYGYAKEEGKFIVGLFDSVSILY